MRMAGQRYPAIARGQSGGTRGGLSLRGLVVFVVGCFAFLADQDLLGDQAGVLADRGFDPGGDIGVLLEESF